MALGTGPAVPVTAVELPPASWDRDFSFSPETAPRVPGGQGLWVPTGQMWGSRAAPQHIPGAILGPNFARVFHCCLSPGSVRGAGTGRALTQDPRGCEAMSGPRPSGLLPRAAAAGSGLPRLSSEPLADTRGWTVLIPLSFSRCLWTERSPARDIAISSPRQNDPSPGQNDPWPGHSDPGLKRSPRRKAPTFVGGKTKPRPLPALCYESANSSCRVVTDISIIQWPTGERTPRQ